MNRKTRKQLRKQGRNRRRMFAWFKWSALNDAGARALRARMSQQQPREINGSTNEGT